MTISSSLNAGVAGLSANANRLATISDNIANASTNGYRRVEAQFHSMVISGSGGSSYSAGGVRATTQRLIDQGGSIIGTSNATDLAVRGRGFLPVTQAAGLVGGTQQMQLATTGSFRLNEDGHLVTGSGLALLGWPAAVDGTIPNYPRDTNAGLEPVQVNVNEISGAPTTALSLSLNLPAAETDATGDGDAETLSVEYYDNLGASQSLQLSFTPTIPAAGSSNEWTLAITDTALGAVVGEYTLTFDDGRASGGTLLSVADISGGAYDPATGSVIVTVAGGPIELTLGELGDPQGLTQLASSFAPVAIQKDGFPVGNMTSVEVDENGYVQALYDTGVTRTLYQVPLVDLPNPNGLTAMDGQTYIPTTDSGAYYLWDAGDGPTGEVISYGLEGSATDVAGELTDMIQTQRAYSSNAKVIQTVDEMLQETTNIKR